MSSGVPGDFPASVFGREGARPPPRLSPPRASSIASSRRPRFRPASDVAAGPGISVSMAPVGWGALG
eukprot:CAMPEP_0167797364 /NCGR_PEP_ID=MMETSP0111_2-20121227/15603_1 /TAXON_ID=91324 /ORGANISM="Lotharella globosa, Strain CCCM811" /LENGTH=66 /DNA_ID=CAMNT_0007691441 /DNA_START=225 /DNA_END=421 /DNA_ORIENTATION=-